MNKQFDFYFDVASPTTYLAWTQLPRLMEETGANAVFKPIYLSGVFKAVKNSGPAAVPAKAAYMLKDMMRYAKSYDVPFAHNRYFPINSLPLQRGAVALLNSSRFDEYLRIVYEAMWVKSKNLNDPKVIAETLSAGAFDPQTMLTSIESEDIKQKLQTFTNEAIARGAFGAPTFFVGDEMFFGQDRISHVRDALNA